MKTILIMLIAGIIGGITAVVLEPVIGYWYIPICFLEGFLVSFLFLPKN